MRLFQQMTCAPLMCFRSTSSHATYLHSRHSGNERCACAQESSCWRSANWSRLEALCGARPKVNICQLSTCTRRLHHIRDTGGSLPSRQNPHGMKMLKEEELGILLTHHRFPPVYTTQKLESRMPLPLSHPSAQKGRGKEGHIAGREVLILSQFISAS